MNIVMIIPTGIGCEIGGHAGDANPVAKLLGKCCDRLILHPNVVNASDVNEMPPNAWYVEGSILDRFLEGGICLKESNLNKILVVVNKPVRADTVNAVSTSRVTIGSEVNILELNTELQMIATMEDGKASGVVTGWLELVDQVKDYKFDALAIHTEIEVPDGIALNYYRNGGVNPWGGVEAIASRLIADRLNKPVAHAPLESVTPEDSELFFINVGEVVDSRIAPEAISNCYLHCVMKGLHQAPRISPIGFSRDDINFLVSPYGCWGKPHKSCMDKGIPIIIVKENYCIENFITGPSPQIQIVENYWEAAGVIQAKRAGITPSSVRRPLEDTKILL